MECPSTSTFKFWKFYSKLTQKFNFKFIKQYYEVKTLIITELCMTSLIIYNKINCIKIQLGFLNYCDVKTR